MKKLLALALACTMALSSTIFVAAEDIEMPDPVAKYTFDDDSKYEVVSNGSGTVEVVEDMNAETGKGKGNVLHVPASGSSVTGTTETGEEITEYTDTEISLPNPFAGMDLSEGTQTADVRGDNYEADDIGMPIWYEGVVINYWIKTVDDTNSVVINFRNNDRRQYHKDDWRKHVLAVEAKEAYDAAAASGEPIDPRFALGTVETYYGEEEGQVYKVYSGGGEYMNYNPDYEDGYALGAGEISAYKEGADPELEESWVLIGTAGVDEFEAFYELDWKINDKCKVRQADCDGFLQFSMDGSVYFAEDDASNTNDNPYVTVAKPNEINIRNSLRMNGSTSLTDVVSDPYEDSEGWHMVTIVIQNDWIDYYLDGELYEDLADEFTFYGSPLCVDAGGKSFNAGFGLRAPFQRGTAGRGNYLNGNRAGSLLTEWLSYDNTTLSIGGTNALATSDGNAYPERVAEFWIDDVAFYNTLLDEDQIWNLYEEGLAGIDGPKTLIGDVDKDGDIDAADALAVLKHAAKLESLEDTKPAMTNSDTAVDANDALNILKYAAKLIDKLPVE